MKKTFFLAGVFCALFAVSCATTATTKQHVPEWVLNPPNDSGVVYGIGYSNSFEGEGDYDKYNSRIAEEKAYLAAIYELYLGGHRAELTTILGIMDNFQFDAEDFTWVLNGETRTVKLTWDVRYMKTVKLEKSSDGAWWCLAVYEYKRKNDELMGEFKTMEELFNHIINEGQ